MMHEFQRMEAVTQYRPAAPGVADSLALNWPALRNYAVFRNDLPYVGRWLDTTRPPLGAA